MNQYYYVASDNKSYGPVTPDQFARYGINGRTLVCPVGGTSWVPASNIPELRQYLDGGYQQPYQQHYHQAPPYNPQQPNPGYPPSSHMVWAILVTIFCCLPFGIVAIVKASNVSSLWYQGRYDESIQNSNDAKKWCMWSALASLIGTLLYLVFFCIFGSLIIL
ncbi:MAG: CD225/dispanin family protein [Prevotella sp.]|nr:CD225/dispanin family protein [Prevotella sp.]MCM1074114.1 CD225/dispanin family protein [Ruminococcus sp.]